MTKMAHLVQLQDISAAYNGHIVLSDVNFDIETDDFTAITGPNGCGKTTLAKIILGLKKPQSGEVVYYREGRPTDSLRMGYLPQYTDIDKKFPISVRDVILSGLESHTFFPYRYTRQDRQKVEDVVGLMGLETLASRHIEALSGGQLQRVLLARAVVSKPELVILDEPNTYVDRQFQGEMYKMLHAINRHCAIIIISHDLDTMRCEAKRVIEL